MYFLPPLLDCRERDFIMSQMHMALKSWSLQNGGGCVCFVLSFGVWLFVKLMTILHFKKLNLIFCYLPITKMGTPFVVEKGQWGLMMMRRKKREGGSIILHVIYIWQRIIHRGAHQSTVMHAKKATTNNIILMLWHAFLFAHLRSFLSSSTQSSPTRIGVNF